ncbi:MAG: uracil-DNA glycosylase [Lentisphaeraceae bacterium]|nr:uracil-DNA glycosylase [Lentisphaeraceae bacterium]
MASIIDQLVKNIQHQLTHGKSQVHLESTVLSEFLTDFAIREPVQTSQPTAAPFPVNTPVLPVIPQPAIQTAAFIEQPVQEAIPVPVQMAPEPAPPTVPLTPTPLIAPIAPTAPLQTVVQVNVDGLNLGQLRNAGNTCSACKQSPEEVRSLEKALNENAELMVITEPSGRSAAQQVDPFAGDAGELLCKMIRAMKINLDDVYLCMAHRCNAPGSREHIGESKPYLQRQIELVKPKVILIFGGAALNILLGEQVLQNKRGQWLEIMGIPAIATFPPAYLLRKDEGKRAAWEDIKKVMALL